MYFPNSYDMEELDEFYDDYDYDDCMYCPFSNMYRQYPAMPPSGGPPQGGVQGRPPSGPPPSAVPQKSKGIQTKAVDPGAIRHCLYRFVYIWPTRGRGFWAWLTFVGRSSVAGFRWDRFRWVYFGMDLRRIDSFVCY